MARPASFGVMKCGQLHPEFRLLAANGGSLFAVYEESNPYFLCVLYDADSGVRWPFFDGKGGYSFQRIDRVGVSLIKRIRQILGEPRYRFGYYGEPPIKERPD
jgi:hypothetical protein